ncbi:MAG: PIG-L family deacetylase [Acidobacteriota bacterium]|nr:PIG-L family deacetylase [Acidobacteriota bacterium]
MPRQDGASEVWQKLLKLRTTASVMHVTAHPDDEHGGVLAKLSRGDGARLALLTLNRGESGDNAIGPQLFDGLGLIRTEELLNADRHYGVDEQYFTTVVDYGFSKRLEEALDKWGRETVLRDVVRIIRMNRPTIILSRFQGNERDGHGNHQTAGLMAVEGFRAAGDPNRYPEQIAEGLRPWRAKKVYIGGVRENEDWTVRIDSGEYSPRLGDSYDNVARYGLSFQRSQNSGRFTPGVGQNFGYYKLVATAPGESGGSKDPPLRTKETSVFDGIPTTLEASVGVLGKPIDEAVAKAMAAFTINDPSAIVPSLAQGLKLTRDALTVTGVSSWPESDEATFLLRIKERQFQDAINSALGLELTALAQPNGMAEPTGPGAAFAPPALMAAPVPGQSFEVRVRLANRGGVPISLAGVRLEAAPGWNVSPSANPLPSQLARHENYTHRFGVTLAGDVAMSTKPYFSRKGLQESRYTLSDPAQFGRPASAPPLVAVVRYAVGGVPVEIRETVKRREAKLPYGDVLREVRSVPRLAVMIFPTNAIVPIGAAGGSSASAPRASADKKDPPLRTLAVEVSLLHNAEDVTAGQVALRMPAGWTSEPASQPFSFARAGERASYRFSVRPGAIDAKSYSIEAVATTAPHKGVPYDRGGGVSYEYREGYELIDHRDLEVRYLYRNATADVRGLEVTTVAGLKVGYVMGVGDQVPLGLQQLGAQVTLLGDRELASADLSAYDTIMTGTRAYAVRDDLKTYNQRLIDYAKAGGNVVVLYNTQEFVPNQWAPFPADLPRGAEEVSEEDSPVTILAPTQQSFTWPNKITLADFDGWMEQRGSKFFTKWDPAYTPMISTFDKGQAPQSGGWVTAKVGKGNWTYFAYALHRQLPYGVPGAFRITANLLALSKSPK